MKRFDSLLLDIDRQFGRLMAELAGEPDNEALFLAAALASHNTTRRRNSCLELASVAGKALFQILDDPPEGIAKEALQTKTPELKDWLQQLATAATIGKPGEYKPLILDEQQRLFLYRYWHYEQQLADTIRQRLQYEDVVPSDKLTGLLDRLFPASNLVPDWQKKAALTVLAKSFVIISGGPGTGKTHTVTSILAMLLTADPALKIALCAPTGKAAARLQDSIRAAKHRLTFLPAEILNLIPENAGTIHRLLGFQPGSAEFRHNRRNPLVADVVVVDEASMVSLSLMSKLLQAITEQTKLILLGDKNQLSSVEAGAVLGDICDTAAVNSRLADSIVELKHSYRFEKSPEIGAISHYINAGDAKNVVAFLKSGQQTITRHDLPQSLLPKLESLVSKQIIPWFQSASLSEAFAIFESFRMLCAHRSGQYGVAHLNQQFEQVLQLKGWIRNDHLYYRGRPIIIKQNDYALNLYNGDVGMIWEQSPGNLRAYFPGGEQGFFSISLARLPRHESAYAMTIHESQGSEFESIVIVLGDYTSPVLSRELLYTAVTRAKHIIELWSAEELLKQAILKKVDRHSGLKAKLRSPAQ